MEVESLRGVYDAMLVLDRLSRLRVAAINIPVYPYSTPGGVRMTEMITRGTCIPGPNNTKETGVLRPSSQPCLSPGGFISSTRKSSESERSVRLRIGN